MFEVLPAPEAVAIPPPRSRGVLVVDDTAGVRGVVAAGLRQHGFAVWPAAGGVEAVELYRAHREVIDVVLLDVRMPGRDGPQTLAVLREISPHVRCCFMSGDLGGYTEADLRTLGALAVFRKPLRLADVARWIHGLAALPEAAPGDHPAAADPASSPFRPGVHL